MHSKLTILGYFELFFIIYGIGVLFLWSHVKHMWIVNCFMCIGIWSIYIMRGERLITHIFCSIEDSFYF